MSSLSQLFADPWIKIGFLGQAVFTARFVVQWIVSEKRRDSVVPVAFWWLSLAGGTVLLAYATHKRDAVIMVGQAMGLAVYSRNLTLVARARRRAAQRVRRTKAAQAPRPTSSTPKPHRVDAQERTIPFT